MDVHNAVDLVEEANKDLLRRDLDGPLLLLHCE